MAVSWSDGLLLDRCAGLFYRRNKMAERVFEIVELNSGIKTVDTMDGVIVNLFDDMSKMTYIFNGNAKIEKAVDRVSIIGELEESIL